MKQDTALSKESLVLILAKAKQVLAKNRYKFIMEAKRKSAIVAQK